VSGALILRNRQRTCPVNLRVLRRVAQGVIEESAWDADAGLGIYLITSAEMARLNETFLQHKGATDVITFDYGTGAASAGTKTVREGRMAHYDAGTSGPKPSEGTPHPGPLPFGMVEGEEQPAEAEAGLRGEIFVCMEAAVAQARQFRSTWALELTRYVIHGVLHLQGHDDLRAGPRRRMKQVENRLLRRLAGRFDLKQLARS
jgi:rRNA maturation RNase YbeY